MFGGFGDQDSFGANWNLDEIQQLEDITAGGFLEDDAIPQLDETGLQKEKVAPTRQSMMPVKISMIVNAWHNDAGYIQFFNRVPDVMKILGRIESHKSTDENTQFLIDDGTGRITCTFVHPSDMTPFRQRELEKVMQTHRMVVVYGSYNPIYSVNCPAIVIFKIREVYSPDEFTLHELDVINMILRNEKEGTPLQVGDVIDIAQTFAAQPIENQYHNPTGTAASTIRDHPGAAPSDGQTNLTLTKYIAQLLAEETRKGNLNGLHVDAITRDCKMQRNFQSISEQHVRKVLTELEKDATVYQTVDAQTFASTDA
ncbi:uncharacterized protein BXIN_2649 [Babesia sp. Xinjiang]|uniref:uncharacterized protein n=1 Tax=Babesia sp. Xinjiang TaxID=462227 RepID=UPI000A25EE5D|nr:uncharacterized protein BXIN_2672 [Babesia sp. Xinjiang]XP_028872117.1 uncharacterized protein BXIN_2649 [Babesia sp. Xinjiang]ORM41612.1 hypothetical protein BXIN_2672 [Babesia sp. Xinjiang]ORM41661.1 hypothetical protein BXIN_2649 [Babesia sp. Xinjiang]